MNCLKMERRKSVITERKRCGKIRTTQTVSFVIIPVAFFPFSLLKSLLFVSFKHRVRYFERIVCSEIWIITYMKVLTIPNIKIHNVYFPCFPGR
jgi:hypothetical protein